MRSVEETAVTADGDKKLRTAWTKNGSVLHMSKLLTICNDVRALSQKSVFLLNRFLFFRSQIPTDVIHNLEPWNLGFSVGRAHKLTAPPRAGAPCLDAQGETACYHQTFNGAHFEHFLPPCDLEQFCFYSRLECKALDQR